MPPAPFPADAKVPLIASYAGTRGAVWVDDVHTPEAWAWTQARRTPTRLIGTDPAVGLTRANVRQAVDWVATTSTEHAEWDNLGSYR
jgi:hypothetical protein